MALTKEQILAYSGLQSVGNVSVFKINDYLIKNNLELSLDPKDMFELFQSLINQQVLQRLHAEDYSVIDIKKALERALFIIEKSDELGIKTIGYNDNIFPAKLKSIVDEKGKNVSPLVLYVKGCLDHLNDKGIAIIGTRQPTDAGVQAGLYFSEKFAERGYNVISGLALGCDTTAHKGALKAGGITTAFVAHGLEQNVYPKENAELAESILANDGLIISEYPIGTRLVGQYLVARDRLQSGLADATLAIQTGVVGGTMHAVNATIHNNKPLLMVRYREEEMKKEHVQGNAKLIAEGKAIGLGAANFEEVLALVESRVGGCEIKKGPTQLTLDF